jgi:hypothetical protein
MRRAGILLGVSETTESLTDAERLALEWYRAGDPRTVAIAEELRASLARRYLLVRMTPPGGVLYAISPRGLRALRAPQRAGSATVTTPSR